MQIGQAYLVMNIVKKRKIINMPEKIEKAFEKEYTKKGYTKAEADLIFFKWESKHHLKDKDKK